MTPPAVFVLPAAGGGGAAHVFAPSMPSSPGRRSLPAPGAVRLEGTVIWQLWLQYLERERERATRYCTRCSERHVCLTPGQQRQKRREQRQRRAACKAQRARTHTPYCVRGCPGCWPVPKKQRPGLCRTCGHLHECLAVQPVRPKWWSVFEQPGPHAYQRRMWALEQARLRRLAEGKARRTNAA